MDYSKAIQILLPPKENLSLQITSNIILLAKKEKEEKEEEEKEEK